MADLEPFPELIERQRLDPDRINGVNQARLTIGADGDAVVTFRDEVAAFQNVLGVYLPRFPGWVGRWLAFGPEFANGISWIAVSGWSDREVRDG